MHQIPQTLLKTTIKNLAASAHTVRKEERRALETARGFHLVAMNDKESPPPIGKYKVSSEEISSINYDLYQNLRHRRTMELRRRARYTYLAYGFLRGLKYDQMELNRHEEVTGKGWIEVEKIIFNHLDPDADARDVKQKFEEWFQAARKVTEQN